MLFEKDDYKYFFRNQLSWYFVPILLIIWFFLPNYNYIFANTMICVGIIGIIEIIFYEKKLGLIWRVLSIIGHLLIFIPFIPTKYFSFKSRNPQIKKKSNKVYFNLQENKTFYKNNFKYLTEFNIYNFFLYIISMVVIVYLPYWPYFMSRITMILFINIITISLWIYAFQPFF